MVEFSLNQRTCLGMDEGFKSFEPEVEHDFVKQLRSFVALSASARPSAAPEIVDVDHACLRLGHTNPCSEGVFCGQCLDVPGQLRHFSVGVSKIGNFGNHPWSIASQTTEFVACSDYQKR